MCDYVVYTNCIVLSFSFLAFHSIDNWNLKCKLRCCMHVYAHCSLIPRLIIILCVSIDYTAVFVLFFSLSTSAMVDIILKIAIVLEPRTVIWYYLLIRRRRRRRWKKRHIIHHIIHGIFARDLTVHVLYWHRSRVSLWHWPFCVIVLWMWRALSLTVGSYVRPFVSFDSLLC